MDDCPSCSPRSGIACSAVWPASALDVLPVRCELPRGHRSEEHWHRTLWPPTPDVVWFDEPEHEPDLEGPRPTRRRKATASRSF